MSGRAAGLALGAFVPAGSLVVDPWGFAPFGPLKLGVAGALGLLGVGLASWRHRVIFVDARTGVAWIGLLAWLALAAAFAADELHAWIGTPDRRFGALTWLVVGALFVTAQCLVAAEARIVGRAGTLAAAGIGLYASLELAGWAPVDGDFAGARVGGPYGQPAYLGAAAALLTPLAVGFAADRREPPGWRRAGVAGMVLGTIALLGSQSRAAWIGAAAAGLVLVVLRRAPLTATLRSWTNGRGIVAAAGAGGALLGLALLAWLTPLGGRAASLAEPGEWQSRLDEWDLGVAVAADRPVLGAGPEGYRVVVGAHISADYERTYGRVFLPDRVHSAPLDMAVVGGIPAAMAWLVLAGLVVAAAARVVGDADQPGWLVGAAVGVVATFAQQLFLFPLAEVDPALWLLGGIVVGAGSPATTRRLVAVPRLVPLLAAVLLAATLVAGALDVAADRELDQAVAAVARGETVAALAHADRATQLRPDSIRAWYLAARMATRSGTILGFDAAIERIEAGLERSPRDPALLTELGALVVERAQRSGLGPDQVRAVEVLEDLVGDDPNNGANRLRLGVAYSLSGQLDEAVLQLATAEDLAPTSAAPPANLALTLLRLGDRPGAQAAAERALALDPSNPTALSVLDDLQ